MTSMSFSCSIDMLSCQQHGEHVCVCMHARGCGLGGGHVGVYIPWVVSVMWETCRCLHTSWGVCQVGVMLVFTYFRVSVMWGTCLCLHAHAHGSTVRCVYILWSFLHMGDKSVATYTWVLGRCLHTFILHTAWGGGHKTRWRLHAHCHFTSRDTKRNLCIGLF